MFDHFEETYGQGPNLRTSSQQRAYDISPFQASTYDLFQPISATADHRLGQLQRRRSNPTLSP